MKDTFTQFIDFLRENRDQIRNDLEMSGDSWRRELYGKVFYSNYLDAPDPVPVKASVSSTDSTEFIRELYNGKKLILIRAYTVIGRRLYTSFISRVISVSRDDLQRFTIMLMEHTEHLSILEMLKSEKPEYVLVDGSLGGRIYRDFRPVEAEGHGEFHKEYLKTLGDLIDTASAMGVPLIFMAKSSETSIFRRYLMGLLKNGNHDPANFSEEEKLKASDHFIVKSMARATGYTRPLLQPAPRLWISRQERFPMATTHILPRKNDLPIKVDVVSPDNSSIPDQIEPASIDPGIMNLLFWGYGDLKTYNIWLADVDRLVKFRNSEVENIYMKAFEREIGISFYETRGERRARLRI